MSKRVTSQDGKIELIVADGVSDIDIGADGSLAGIINLGLRVDVDSNGNLTVQDSSDTYSWTLEPQASWIELTASNPGASEYGFYFEVGGEVGQYDVAVAAPSQPPVVADGAFDARFNIWSQNNPISYELANFGFNGSADLEIYNGIRGGNMLLYTFNDGGTFKQITFDPDAEAFRLEDGLSLFIQEQATPNASVATYGQIWVQTATPNRLMFTDDGGNDVVVAEFGTGPVNATGSPLDNQVAVFLDGDTIEGDANFTWTGTTLAIAGAGAQLLLPLENEALTPTLGFGDGDTGFFETSDDVLRLSIGTLERFQWDTNQFEGVAANAPAFVNTTPSTTVPTLRPNKTDTDTGIGHGADQLSLIAGAKEMLRLVETGTATTDQVIITPAVVSPAGGATPTLAFGDGDTGFYENADDELSIAVNGARQWYYSGVSFRGNAADSPALENNTPTSTDPNIIPNRSDLNTGLGWAAADHLSLVTGGVESQRLHATTAQTTDATQTEILIVDVASGEGYGFEIHIIGTEDSTGDSVFERIFGAIRNQGGTTALIGSTVVDRTADTGAAAWTVTVAADDTLDRLTVDVTGEAAHTIDWKCRVNLLQV